MMLAPITIRNPKMKLTTGLPSFMIAGVSSTSPPCKKGDESVVELRLRVAVAAAVAAKVVKVAAIDDARDAVESG